MGSEGRKEGNRGSGISWTHLHAGVDHGHKYHQGQQQETGQVETQHEHGAGRREEVGNSGALRGPAKEAEFAPFLLHLLPSLGCLAPDSLRRDY